MEDITEREFIELVGFVKLNYGINLSEKKVLVCGRLTNYIVQSGFHSFSEYFCHVKSDRTGKAGVVLVNKLTTNHTYFLREPQHFDILERVILPYYAEIGRASCRERVS